jgi:hypothetical protein
MPRVSTYPARPLARLLGVDAAGLVGLAPAPPPANRRIAFLGDSRIWQATLADAGNFGHYSGGIQSWLRFLSGQRFDYDPNFGSTVSTPVSQVAVPGGMNFGVPSDRTAEMLARLPAALGWSDAAIWVVLGGTNDAAAGIASSVTTGNLAAIRDMILAAGRIVLFVAEVPRGSTSYNSGSAPLSGSNLAIHLRNRQWILSQRSVPGVYVADPWRDLADTSSVANSNAGYIVDGVTQDGLHQTTPGAYLAARSILDQINALLPPVDLLPACGADAWSTDNPTGLLTPNPSLLGSGGTITSQAGVAASGQLADGWTTQFSAAASGLTLVYSKVVSGGRPMQQIAASGTPTALSSGADIIRLAGAVPHVAAGDVVEALAEVEIDAPVNVRALSLYVYDATGARFYGDMLNTSAYAGDTLPGTDLRGVMRTPTITVPAGANLRFGLLVKGVQDQPIDATIRVGALGLRRLI